MRFPKLRATFIVLLATSGLAACSSRATGMLPTGPQTQSLSQAPSRVAVTPASGVGVHATAHTPNAIAPSIGSNRATAPIVGIGRAHADDVSSGGSTPCNWQNYVPPGASGVGGGCYSGGGGGSGSGIIITPGGGGTGGCSSNVECGQPCYEGGSGCGPRPSPSPTIPPCVTTGPSGTAAFVGPKKDGSKSTSLDSMIAQSTPLKNLTMDLANIGATPTLTITQPVTEPAFGSLTGSVAPSKYTPEDNTISWSPGSVDYGVDYAGQSATQVLFHEYDHAWYAHTTSNTAFVSPTMSATIGGVSYSWTLYSISSSGSPNLNSNGWNGYQHMLIHDDLVHDFGTDKTGALGEALAAANNPPPNPSKLAASLASESPSFPTASSAQKGRPGAPKAVGQFCSKSAIPQSIGGRNFFDLLPTVD